MSDEAAPQLTAADEDDLTCEHYNVPYDEDEARKLGSREVRSRWPRFHGKCSCGYEGIAYASYGHYLRGGW